MTRFKRFPAGTPDDQITDFINKNLIIRDRYLENGESLFFYKPLNELGTTPIDFLERVDKAITEAEKHIFDASQDEAECDSTLADLDEKISGMTENDEGWKQVQEDRSTTENIRTLARGTQEGRGKQLVLLGLQATALVNEICG